MQQWAVVFPGQGSQQVGMLADLAAAYPELKESFKEASEALGYDVWDLVQNGDQEQLNLTEYTQPILLASSVAIWRLWLSQGGDKPAAMAGHSLGEFSALVCAGALEFADALRLVRARGQFMQTAVPVGVGAMAAVMGLDDDAIVEACRQSAGDEVVEAVNFNAPGQVVIAGHVGAVERASQACKDMGAKRAVGLPVSAPFHTSLMRPAGEKLEKVLADVRINTPEIPVVHNVHAQTESDPARIETLLTEQIYSPVKWVGCVRQLVDSGVGVVLECGPGKVLSGLNKRIHKPLNSYTSDAPASFEAALAAQKQEV